MIDIQVQEGVATLTLANPPLNIITRAVMAQIRERLAQLEQDSTLRVLVLASEGKHFSAGADVPEHLPPQDQDLIGEFSDTILALDRFPVPVIAAVQGKCLGGGFELVQPADMIVASEGASFGQPEIMLGVLPPVACALLPSLLPPGLAARILYSGDVVSAVEARDAGLVLEVVPEDQLQPAVASLASRIARHSAAALRCTKRATRFASAQGREPAVRGASQIYLDELMKTNDALEGLNSFVEKRRPTWTNS